MQKLAGFLRANRGSYAGLNASPRAYVSPSGAGYLNPARRNIPAPIAPVRSGVGASYGGPLLAMNHRINDYTKNRIGPADSRLRGF